MPEPIYTIYDICSETGVNKKTIQKWIWLGLVPHALPSDNDQMIRYNDTHMRRVIKVRDWRDAQITLTELAERLAVIGERALEVPDPYAGIDWDDDE